MKTWGLDYSELGGPGSPQPIVPMPEAHSSLVIGWLGRVRRGSILGLVVVMYYAALVMLWMFGVNFGRSVVYTASCVISIVGAMGVWILVSSEPRNRKWLWLSRWILRIASVVLIGLCTLSVLTYGFFRPLPEMGQADGRWSRFATSITMFLWF